MSENYDKFLSWSLQNFNSFKRKYNCYRYLKNWFEWICAYSFWNVCLINNNTFQVEILRTWFYKNYCDIKEKFTQTVKQYEVIFDVVKIRCIKINAIKRRNICFIFKIGSGFCEIDNKLIWNHTFFFQFYKQTLFTSD